MVEKVNAKRCCVGHNERLPNYGYSSYLKKCHLREFKIGLLTKSCPWNASNGGPWDSLASQTWSFVSDHSPCSHHVVNTVMLQWNFLQFCSVNHILPFQPCSFMTNLAPATMMTRTTTQLRFPLQLILVIGKFQQWWSPSRFPTVGGGVREIRWASTQLPPQTSSMWCSVCRFNESPQFGAWATTWRGWPRALGRAEKLI